MQSSIGLQTALRHGTPEPHLDPGGALGANVGATRVNDFLRQVTDTDRQVAITPAHGPIRTLLNA
jgi:hypothetical protein